LPSEHNRVCLASPNIVSDEAGVGFNGVCEGYSLCGEACAKASAPERLLWFSHIPSDYSMKNEVSSYKSRFWSHPSIILQSRASYFKSSSLSSSLNISDATDI
jgi:hypothetical protein